MNKYIEQIASMKYRVLNGFVSPHKAIMLLGVIDMIEFQLVEGNNFYLDNETKEAFMFNWNQYLEDRCLPFKANPWVAFWHLHNEPFWHLVPKDENEDAIKNLVGPGETATLSQMSNVIAYAKLDDELYSLLCDAEFRDSVKKILIDKFINAKKIEVADTIVKKRHESKPVKKKAASTQRPILHKSVKVIEGDSGEPHLFFIKKYNEILGSGTFDPVTNTFRLLPGSRISAKTSSSFARVSTYQEITSEYCELVDDIYIVKKEYIFSSPSTASSVLLGRSSNGWIDWKDALGNRLIDIFPKK